MWSLTRASPTSRTLRPPRPTVPPRTSWSTRRRSPMHDLHETMQWYREHDETAELGFNPDGRCLQICRTARDLPAVYPSAKEAQDATPKEFRVTKIADLRKGMVLYFDDPHDSNQFGHVATMVGRVKGFDEN